MWHNLSPTQDFSRTTPTNHTIKLIIHITPAIPVTGYRCLGSEDWGNFGKVKKIREIPKCHIQLKNKQTKILLIKQTKQINVYTFHSASVYSWPLKSEHLIIFEDIYRLWFCFELWIVISMKCLSQVQLMKQPNSLSLIKQKNCEMYMHYTVQLHCTLHNKNQISVSWKAA